MLQATQYIGRSLLERVPYLGRRTPVPYEPRVSAKRYFGANLADQDESRAFIKGQGSQREKYYK